MIPALQRLFGLPIGYSGHELGYLPTLAAVALGACVVERHFTLSRRMRGSDQAISLDPEQFRSLTADLRAVEAALGSEQRRVLAVEAPFRSRLGKGIVAARDLVAGHVLTADDLALKSPAKGLPGTMLQRLLGKTLRRPLTADDPLLLDDVVDA